MAAIKKRASIPQGSHRVSPLKPGLRGARNWASAQMRSASHTRKGFIRFTLSIVFVFLSLAFVALWLGGFLPQVKQASSDFTRARMMSMGFVIDRVDVMGEGRLHEEDVRTALNITPGDYLFGVDLEGAQARVESLSWVDRAIVRRLWPDRIVVQIIERQPYALWQNEGDLQVIDAKGTAISDADAARFAELKIFVGEKAGTHATDFESLIGAYPEIASRAEAFVQVDNRRWDIVMAAGDMRVKLPASNVQSALARLQQFHRDTQILDREISVIDMRLPDRLTLRAADQDKV